jgi:hypothetical protein
MGTRKLPGSKGDQPDTDHITLPNVKQNERKYESKRHTATGIQGLLFLIYTDIIMERYSLSFNAHSFNKSLTQGSIQSFKNLYM